MECPIELPELKESQRLVGLF